MIVDTTTGEVLDVGRLMSMRDLNRPEHERPASWSTKRRNDTYTHAAYKRRSRRQPHPLAQLLIGLAAVVIATMIIRYVLSGLYL